MRHGAHTLQAIDLRGVQTMINPYRAILRDRGLVYRPILGEASAKTVKGQKIGY
jgi:hypothetical protein